MSTKLSITIATILSKPKLSLHDQQSTNNPINVTRYDLENINLAKNAGVTFILWASLVTQMVKNPPAMQETWVQSLGWEDPLEEGMATHSSILA